MTISVNELTHKVGMTSTITLIICTVIIVVLLIGIYFRRRAKKRRRPAGPLETASQQIHTKTKEEKKWQGFENERFTGMLQMVWEW